MSVLTKSQSAFASELSRLTGLDAHVIGAWTLAEESGGAAHQREAQRNHNWLNIGYFDSGAGSITQNRAFRDPVSAAHQTAKFLQGQWGGASPRIRAIINAAHLSADKQLQAIYSSDWATGHYGSGRDLMSTYNLVRGQAFPTTVPVLKVTGVASAPAQPAAQTPPDNTLALQRHDFAQGLIDSTAKNAHIPSFKLPFVNAPVQADTPEVHAQLVKTPKVEATISHAMGLAAKQLKIVQDAKKYLGVKYVWGGTTPQGFDCSGLVQYVFKHFGINIPRVTTDQVKAGHAVVKGHEQPGDLVFFGTWSNPHHVGMYIGNGLFIQAPHTGDVVKISHLGDRGDYLTVRRFV